MCAFVMVIDDSLVIRKILETCLRRAGYEVKSFSDGVEALQWCSTAEARIPALVLVDVGLPKLDGYDVIRYLKAKPALVRTVFVIVSRRDGVLDRLKGRLVGAHAYLTKPFKTQDLLTIIQAQLGALVVEHNRTLTGLVYATSLARRTPEHYERLGRIVRGDGEQ
jgi:twitching motility two-component system response regulator PilG